MGDDEGNCFELSYLGKSIYNDHTRFMVSWWIRYSYLKKEQIQTRDFLLLNAAYGSSGSFGPRVWSKSNIHNTYTGRISNIRSK